ncbi:MAG TPA: hypothetical protein VIW03_13850 [Anaeromyxobacter sp.]
MRELVMAVAVTVAALIARDARADQAKDQPSTWDKTKVEVKKDARAANAQIDRSAQKARDWTRKKTGGDAAKRANEDRKHPLFAGKDNYEVKGKITKVSTNTVTIARDELPPATLIVSPSTKVEVGGEAASVKQLKAGQDVKASFNLEGSKAEAVEIKAEKAK